MQNATTRNFNPGSVPGLSAEARKAVNAALDAISTWRTETAKNSEKNIEQIIEKMAAAAQALGWPERIVDATREQMHSTTKMQIQTMDHMMDAWEEQIKSPNPSALLSKLNSLPGFTPRAVFPTQKPSQMATLNPFQAYMQLAEQWQEAWASATDFWTKGGRSS